MSELIDTVTAATAFGAAVRPKVGGFPYLAEAMRQAGITRNYFDVPSMSMVFVTAKGAVLRPGALLHTDPVVVPPFDKAALIAALRADQRGETTFPQFVEASFSAGIIRYEVDTTERTCTYYGCFGETYVEQYDAVELPPAPVPAA